MVFEWHIVAVQHIAEKQHNCFLSRPIQSNNSHTSITQCNSLILV
jgi:hypothetical protein